MSSFKTSTLAERGYRRIEQSKMLVDTDDLNAAIGDADPRRAEFCLAPVLGVMGLISAIAYEDELPLLSKTDLSTTRRCRQEGRLRNGTLDNVRPWRLCRAETRAALNKLKQKYHRC